MTKKYTLSKGIIIRKEWFGCLVCNTYSGQFFQFNEDTFEILKELKKLLTAKEMQRNLKQKELIISLKDLESFLQEMHNDEIVTLNNRPQGAMVFFEDKHPLRKDCLVSPSSVTIYITNVCSKTCKHCVTKASPLASQDTEYTPEKWFLILKKLRDFGVCALVFTGGEPFLKDGIFDILKKADEMNFSISILSDFDNINSKHIALLKNLHHLVDFQISLDGKSETVHDAIRGKGSFHKALRRMKLLQNHNITYTISTTINNRNINEIDEIVDISKKYGAKYLYLNPLAPYGRAKETMQDWLLSEDQLYWLGKKYLRLTASGEIDPGNPFWKENVSKIEDDQFYPFKGALTAVSLGIYNFSIGSTGECYLDSKMKSENILYLGNALTDNLETMWHNTKLNHLREHYSSAPFTFIDQSMVIEK